MANEPKERPQPFGQVRAEDIRRIVETDKATALEVIRAAKNEVHSFRLIVPQADITGKPDGLRQFARYKGDQLRNLEHVTRAPYFLRVTSECTMKGKREPVFVLLTKAREVGAVVFGDNWLLTTWTSPLGLAIRGAAPGERVEISRVEPVTYDVLGRASYEDLLPRFVTAEFRPDTESVAALKDEDELDQMLASAIASGQLPPATYESKTAFGLSEIIVLVDEPQRAALALPFNQSAIIEGPPGSGKTSIGIMRLAVLYDQQWEELGLKRDRDKPFHDYHSMRVLVYNDEMVEYLKSLAHSIGVDHVQVGTTKDFFRQICRETRLLSGTERRDKTSLATMKGRREALPAYFAGFRAHALRYWENHEGELRRKLFDLAPDFLVLADRLGAWFKRIEQAKVTESQLAESLGIADVLTDAADAIVKEASSTRHASSPISSESHLVGPRRTPLKAEVLNERMSDARKLIESTVRAACNRASITLAMFEQPEYQTLCEALRNDGISARSIDDGDRLWRKQYAGDLPAYSELDLAMSAWLGARLLLSSRATRKPWIGGRLEKFSHVVVDEAQDLSPNHIAVIASHLVSSGTMTLVGDIHQNLNPHAGLRSWNDARLFGVARSAFGVNHRQTRELGTFLQSLHAAMFQEQCPWQPAEKLTGEVPRASIARSWDEIALVIANESLHWRDVIQGQTGATVAVLYDGRIEPKRLEWLRRRLELALSDQLIPVELAIPQAGGEPLRRTDRVVIASVRQTKGLEFDAVVFAESRPRWSKPLNEIDLRQRNGFYVAASRARGGFSMCMANLPQCIDELASQGLCQIIANPRPPLTPETASE